jgi:hypothetical protein
MELPPRYSISPQGPLSLLTEGLALVPVQELLKPRCVGEGKKYPATQVSRPPAWILLENPLEDRDSIQEIS